MPLFKTGKRKRNAQQYLARLATRRSLEKLRVVEEQRGQLRTDLCIGIWIIPLAEGQPNIRKAVPAITRDFTCMGIGFVAYRPPVVAEEVLLAIPDETEVRLLRVTVHNCMPLGAEWQLLNAEVIELLDKDEHPSLTPLFQA